MSNIQYTSFHAALWERERREEFSVKTSGPWHCHTVHDHRHDFRGPRRPVAETRFLSLSFDAAELDLVGCYLFSVTVTTNRINISSFPSCLCRTNIVVLFPHGLSPEVTDEVKAIF